jgi:PadR family transcriptional regulator PadR
MLLPRSDEQILLAVWRLQDEAYGTLVLERLESSTGREWSIAGVYAPLKRMRRAGLLVARESAPLPQRGGRRRRYYRLTALGVHALSESKSRYEAMWAGWTGQGVLQ